MDKGTLKLDLKTQYNDRLFSASQSPCISELSQQKWQKLMQYCNFDFCMFKKLCSSLKLSSYLSSKFNSISTGWKQENCCCRIGKSDSASQRAQAASYRFEVRCINILQFLHILNIDDHIEAILAAYAAFSKDTPRTTYENFLCESSANDAQYL